MNLVCLNEVFRQSNRVALYLRHFAKGYYPTIDHAKKPVALNVNRLFFVLDNRNGECCFIGDAGEKHVLRAGEVFFVPLYHPAIFRLDDGLRFVSIQFNLEMIPGIDLFSGLHRIWHKAKPELTEIVSAFFDDADSPLLPLKLKQVAYDAIVEVLSDFRVKNFEETARFAPYKKLLEWLDAHCTAQTRIAEFAVVMNMSRTAFVRKFTGETRMTPKHFFDRQLTAKAARLLMRPGKSISEAAGELEFSSKYVFSRYFKKHTNLTPGEFRKQHCVTG